MHTPHRLFVASLVTLGAIVPGASAAVSWNETIGGDLSGNPLAPTPVVMALGSNSVIGSVTSSNDHRDYITFTIAPGQALTGIFLDSWINVSTGGNGNTGFSFIDDGATSVIPDGSTIFDFLGGTHVDRTEAPDNTVNLLDLMSLPAAGGTGFLTPLGPGVYTWEVQQTSPLLTSYSFNFVVVPAPGAPALLAAPALLIGMRRRR